MQRVTLVAVGKVRERFISDGIAEYAKRLTPYASLTVREAAEERVPEGSHPALEKQVIDKEAEVILRLLPERAFVIALDRQGDQLSSAELAAKFANLAVRGVSDLAFVIGGTLGLGESVLARADYRLSFSRLTFPHQLMRVILLEQVYRAYKIMRGEGYHR